MNQSRNSAGFVSERVAAIAVTLSTISFWLVVATYPGLFFFNPFVGTDPILRFEQSVSTVAWPLFGILPLLAAWVPRIGKVSTAPAFILGALLWPIIVLVIQVTLTTKGFGFYSYLATYPIMALTDLVVPVVLLVLREELFYKKH